MEIASLTDPAELAEIHTGLLVPAFPPDELADLGSLTAGLLAGTTDVVVLRDGGRVRAVAVGEVFAQGRAVLLAYLATDVASRSAGYGRRVLTAAVDRWRTRHDPCLVLAEVEDPAHHTGSAEHGDPVARVRFYARAGAEALELPYLQPPVRPGGQRVPHLLLVVLSVAPTLRRGPHAVDAAPVATFLTELFTGAEGRLPDDPEGRRLFDAVSAGEALPTRPLAR